jgi:hypothetical protein
MRRSMLTFLPSGVDDRRIVLVDDHPPRASEILTRNVLELEAQFFAMRSPPVRMATYYQG